MSNKFKEKLIYFLPLTFVVGFLLIILLKGHLNFNDIDFNKINGIGGFIGGLIGTFLTIIATVYIYKTYNTQKDELQAQRNLLAQQQFENTFFNLLKFHRELKDSLKFDERNSISHLVTTIYDSIPEFKTENKENYHKSGLEVIDLMRDDYTNIFRLENNRIKKLKESKFYKSRKELIDLLDDFASKSNDARDILEESLTRDNGLKPTDISQTKIDESFEILFNVYQNQISHYCRNVYHILKFIREKEEKSKIEKTDLDYRNYANLFQSQLNLSEQIVLYYNFIHFNNKDKNEYSTIELTNHYSFLENIGINNLIEKDHEKFYNFTMKGSNKI